MTANSKIEWTHHTFNPWWGCQEVSPACDDCYARRLAAFYAAGQPLWGPGSIRRFFGADHWRDPVRWNARCTRLDIRERVFCASMADIFDNHPDVGVARAHLFALIYATPSLDWLLLTKRIGNALPMIEAAADYHFDAGDRNVAGWLTDWYRHRIPPKNAFLMSTVVTQAEADRDIEKLLETPAVVRGLSLEPLLGPIDLTRVKRKPNARDRAMPGFAECTGFFSNVLDGSESVRNVHGEWATVPNTKPKIDWVIPGGESGPKARPSHPQWFKDVRDQCVDAGVPFLFKQWGEWWPMSQTPNGWIDQNKRPPQVVLQLNGEQRNDFPPGAMTCLKVGKKVAGRLLDGRTWDQFPEVA